MGLTISMGDTRNEVDKNAMGGTELMGEGLARHVGVALLSEVNLIRSRVRHVDEHKPNILWLHDLPEDTESQHLRDAELRKRFSKLVYVSNWQKDRYQLFYNISPSEGTVIRNAIEPIPEDLIKKGEGGKLRLIYHPTPHRGLEILVPVFKLLCQEFSNLELDVFSSFNLYGWGSRDEQYRSLIDECIAHPNINYHGTQPQEVVRAALGKADIFAYPSIWMETSCICAMEAMSAKCAILAPNLAALPETLAGFGWMYDYDEDKNRHATTFYTLLRSMIQQMNSQPGVLDGSLGLQKVYADLQYGWSTRKPQWLGMLHSVVQTTSL